MDHLPSKLAAAALTAGIAAAVAIGMAAAEQDNEVPITGAELDQASTAALAHTGGGRVTETEVGDEESYYEVEVTMQDGTQFDVQLDREFNFVGDKREAAGTDDD